LDFWSLYMRESLQSPWVILPEREAVSVEVVEPGQKFVFVTGLLNGDEEALLAKIVAAVKLTDKQLICLQGDSELVQAIGHWSRAHQILFFGDSFPGNFGMSKSWNGQTICRTHSLASLLNQPDLKRQTWQHLKDWVGMDS
jgi:DNA polymerase III psi subunit